MATSSRSAERFKYGICLNDECPSCKEKKVQQIPMRKELICAECGKPLRECPPPKSGSNKKLIGIIATAVVGVAAVGGGIYALTGKSEPKEPLKIELNHTQKTLKVGENDTLTATVTPEGTQATIDWKASNKSNAIEVSNDGIVTAKEEGESKVQVKATANGDTASVICVYTVEKADIVEPQQPQRIEDSQTNIKGQGDKGAVEPPQPVPTPKTVNLGFGIYEGPIVGGKANGAGGTIRFTRSYTIDLKKASGETVEVNSGDRMINVKMKDNRIIQGQLKRKDGSERWIIIG